MGIKEDFISGIRYDDLPNDFKLVADACGIETARLLIEKLGGIRLNIPMAKSLRSAIARIMKAQDGSIPLKKIAIELGCSENSLINLAKYTKTNEMHY